jgi:release factor glutamine methyltransferase
MKTVSEIIALSTKYLQEHQIASPRLQAEELLADVLKCARLDLYLNFDRPLLEEELKTYRELLKRRAKGEPLGYLLSETEFFGCRWKITPDVLIPRPETEILISKVCEQLAGLPTASKQAWDLCCGSGCLGLGLKKRLPSFEVSLSDLSLAALEVAKLNAARNHLEVSFLQGDLLTPFSSKKADVVLCNPPYITDGEYAQLDREVRDFEPKLALTSGPTGLEFYARLARELPDYLNPHAQLFFEIGTGQGEDVLNLFNAPCWKGKRIEKDWAGHDRFFFLEFE